MLEAQPLQAQLLRRVREEDIRLVGLELLRQLQEAPVHAVLAGHAEVGEPVVEPSSRAHEADGHHVPPVRRGMEHHQHLAGVGLVLLPDGSHDLADGIPLPDAGAHPVQPPAGLEPARVGIHAPGEAAIHLDGHVPPARLHPPVHRHGVGAPRQLRGEPQRLHRQRRTQVPEGIRRPGQRQRRHVAQVHHGGLAPDDFLCHVCHSCPSSPLR